jgi:hypothetical protein
MPCRSDRVESCLARIAERETYQDIERPEDNKPEKLCTSFT